MSATVRVVTAREAEALVPVLADVLADCVAGGASVSFMAPYSRADAAGFWQAVAGAVARGTVSLLVAEVDGAVRGTVQVAYDLPPNQPHRGEVRKLLVHRGRGAADLGRALMQAAEGEAARHGRTLLTLDTASPAAERIYDGLGWTRVGTIPDFALYPDGNLCDTVIFYKKLA